MRNDFTHFVRKVFARRKLLSGMFWVFAPLQLQLVVCFGLCDLFGGVYQSGESEEKMFLLAIRKSNRNYLLYVFRDMLGREIMVAAVIKSM